ncbi:MAG TPA: NAD(P)/FAD-dependent oxidoreductase [Jatrophihabitantaceae bacterium]|nr:NAD(P)/FAD-dependent oxidoreductase [Jatrophihabitantaceae bacterium]
MTSYDLVVIGGGPAGIAAALTAAERGIDVCLVDSAPALGGQIWRQPSNGDATATVPASLRAAVAHPRIHRLGETSVWHATPRDGGGATLYLSGRTLDARAVVLATGASELTLPFPGWDLPGVVTPGAAQALLKAHGVPIGRSVVVAGTGPFLWPVAAGLIRAGVRVAALVEAAPQRRAASLAAGLLRHSALVRQAAGYLRIVAASRTRVLTGRAVIAAHGTDVVSSVTVARLDAQGRPLAAGRREIAADAVCVGWGFVPAVEIARSLGCAETRHATRPLSAVAVDADQATSVPGVFAAGEVTGIAGAVAAAAEGAIAGAAAARFLGAAGPNRRRERRRLRAAQRAAMVLDRGYPIPPRWLDWLSDDTVVCRCEEVPWRQVADAIDAGITDVRAIKGQTRCGMGWCQGRVCGPALQSAAAARAGLPVDAVGDLATRPFATPVTIAELTREPR